MNKRRNNKGFTMVELLAAIAILGLLSAIAVVGISSVLNNAEEKHYETQQKNMIMAAQSYAQDNRNVLPKEIGDTRVITLQELQNRKYIGEVVDRSKIACDGASTVTIFKYSKDGYSYKPYLECTNYKTDVNIYGGDGPKITISNIDTTYSKPSFTFSITKRSDDDEAKIISYSYEIYKSGVLVHDSGSVPVSATSSIDAKKISLKEWVPANFTIVIKATNNFGGKTTLRRDISVQDPLGPECGTVTPDYSSSTSVSWQNTSEREFQIVCKDVSGSGCTKEIFVQKFTTESATEAIEISDKAGHKTSCTIYTLIDRTAPDVPVINNDYDGTWVNYDYTIEVSSKDDASGIHHFEYMYPNSSVTEEREWMAYDDIPDGSTTAGTTVTYNPEFSEERSEVVRIRACDFAGNCSNYAETTIRIDKTAPNAPTLTNPYLNQWPLVSDVDADKYVLTVNSSDSASGINKYQYRYPSSSSTWADYASSATDTFTTTAFKTDRNEDVEIRACDKAGNCSNGSQSLIMIDKTAPDVPTLTNPYLNQWPLVSDVNANKYVITVNSSDSGAGIGKYQYRYPDSSSDWNDYASSALNTFTTTAFKTDRNENVEIRACDVVGNCSTGAQSKIMIDTINPTCSISKSGTGSDSNYKSVVTLTLTKTDTGSGVSNYGLVAGNSTANYNNVSTNTQGETSGITWYGFVKDAAGNVGSCNSGNFTVTLRTIPEFTYTGTYEIVDDDDNVITDPKTWTGDWKIRFLSSGTLTFTKLYSAADGIDVFLVGGGGNGGSSYSKQAGRNGYAAGGGGGGGGYRTTQKGVSVSTTSYAISVGAAKTKSTAFGYTANAGNTVNSNAYLGGCDGGPAGGSGGASGGRGGVNLCEPYNGSDGGCEFNDCNFSSNMYGGGGGGGHGHNGYASWSSNSQLDGVGQPGNGGAGGGGTGNNQYRGYNTHNGQANTGGGGGGASFVFDVWDACGSNVPDSSCNCWSSNGCFNVSTTKEYAAGAGGSGIVIIRNKR